MAFGSSLGITLPTVGSTVGPTYATNINSAIQTIADQFETKLTPSSLNINATLDINSQILSNIGIADYADYGSVLSGGSNARRTYFNGDDFYVVDGSGNNVRVTSGGALNVSATGAFGGDYSSSDAVAKYVNATSLYQFLADDDPSDLYATVNMGDLRLHEETAGISNYVALKSPASLAASYTVTLPASLPASEIVASLDASGNLAVVDGSTPRSGYKYSSRSVVQSLDFYAAMGSPLMENDGAYVQTRGASSDSALLFGSGVETGETLDGVTIYYNASGSTGSVFVTLYVYNAEGSLRDSYSFTLNADGTAREASVAPNLLLGGGDSFAIKVGAAGDHITTLYGWTAVVSRS